MFLFNPVQSMLWRSSMQVNQNLAVQWQKTRLEILGQQQQKCSLFNFRQKGEPNIHPTWYYFDNNSKKIYIESGRESKKTQNLRRNNIIYYCIDDDTIPYKGVKGKGTVRISDDVDYNMPIIEKIVAKYLGSIGHPMSQTIISNTREGDAIIIEITPKFYATWDHSKVKK